MSLSWVSVLRMWASWGDPQGWPPHIMAMIEDAQVH